MSDYIPTLADICSAIAEGRVSATIDGTTYQVNALELRRYFYRLSSHPAISTLCEQDPALHTNPDAWLPSTSISVA